MARFMADGWIQRRTTGLGEHAGKCGGRPARGRCRHRRGRRVLKGRPAGAGRDLRCARRAGAIRQEVEMTETSAASAPTESGLQGRVSAWRGRAFGPASELPYRRRTSDVVRLVVTVGLLVLVSIHQSHPTDFENDLFKLINGLPDQLQSFFRLLYRFGALWALGLIVLAALVARRWRLAPRPAGRRARHLGPRTHHRSPCRHRFESARLARCRDALRDLHAVLPRRAARHDRGRHLGCVAVPQPPRPAHRPAPRVAPRARGAVPRDRASRTLHSLHSCSAGASRRSCTSRSDPLAGGRPACRSRSRCEELGLRSPDVHLTDPQPRSGTMMEGHDDAGALSARVLGRDEADAQLAAKAYRFLVYKDGGPSVHLTRLGEVEHEAYTLLLAERAGVAVPSVVVAGTAGPGAALLVCRPLEGPTLADVDPGVVTDHMLDEIWRKVAALHDGARRSRSSQRETDRADRRRRRDRPASNGRRVARPRSSAPTTSPSCSSARQRSSVTTARSLRPCGRLGQHGSDRRAARAAARRTERRDADRPIPDNARRSASG